jgi:hypothetical protein
MRVRTRYSDVLGVAATHFLDFEDQRKGERITAPGKAKLPMGKTLLSLIVASRFRVLFMVFALLTAAPALRSQTASVLSHTVISANPPDTVHFEKAAANFTSTSYPSYFLGTSSDGYVYDTQTGQNCSVKVPGSYYERSRPIVEGSDKYAGVIVSLETSVVWLENPLNWGSPLCGGWGVQVINPNRGAHELHVLDLDGDGKQDVLASGIQQPNGILYSSIAAMTAASMVFRPFSRY